MKWLGHVLFRTLPFVLGIAGLVLVIAWLAGSFREKIPAGEADALIRRLSGEPTDTVHEVTKDYVEEAVGTLKAASRTVISAKVLATILSIEVSAGDEVQVGETLVQLDREQLEAQNKQATQVLAAARANRQEAETSFRRIEGLLQQEVATQSEFDQARRRLEVAKADELGAEQAVRESEVLLSYATLTAPKAGRIVDRLAEPGDTARPGEPILVLYDARSLRLEAPVLEHLALKLRVGEKLMVYIDAMEREVEATVDEIVPQADAPSRSFLVKASVSPQDNLFEGMFGRLRIPAGERRHLCLATDAVQHIGQLQFVDVVRENGELERRMIRTGLVGIPGRIEVLSGLSAGERVVLYPQ